jgi:integrase
MSSSSINAMLKQRQQQFNIPGEISPHGFRRGRLQQLDSMGCSLSAITQHALNKNEAIIQQRYLNRDAHCNNLKRARS